jgi:hypothetical protein
MRFELRFECESRRLQLYEPKIITKGTVAGFFGSKTAYKGVKTLSSSILYRSAKLKLDCHCHSPLCICNVMHMDTDNKSSER